MRHSNPITATIRGILDSRRLPKREITLLDSDRLEGKTALVTGASSGLGKATATELARRGARVLMACRSGIPEVGEHVRAESGSDSVDMLPVDLADPASIRELVQTLADRNERIDVVVCNAGLMPRSSRRAPSGFEMMFAVNYLANVMLLGRLLDADLIRRDGGARIVIVSSESHRSAPPLDFDRVGEYVEYGMATGMKQYGHTKLLLCTYAVELSRRLSGVASVHCLCPGPVASNIAREAPAWVRPLLGSVFRLFFKSPEVASRPVIYLSCSQELKDTTGVYLHATSRTEPSRDALNPQSGARLWEINTKLVARAEEACL